MPAIVADPLLPSCYHCFSNPEHQNINGLVLISFCLAGVREAGALRLHNL